MVVNAGRVVILADECGQAGVGFLVIISSGFAEQSGGGERQSRLGAVCARYPGMRVIGPNTEGLINVVDDIPLGFSPAINYQRGLRRLRAGDVAVIAQSGGLGFVLLNDGLGRGLGFSHVISTGNELDLDAADLAQCLLDDAATRVILLFIEGIDRPGRLGRLADDAAARGKRIVMAKVGARASWNGKRRSWPAWPVYSPWSSTATPARHRRASTCWPDSESPISLAGAGRRLLSVPSCRHEARAADRIGAAPVPVPGPAVPG